METLDLFFNFSTGKISKESFHHDDNTKEISIEVKFGMLSDPEKKKFKIHLDEKEELEIKQIIKLSDEGDSEDDSKIKYQESKHGSKWEAESDLAKLNPKQPTKANIKTWWKQELKIGDFDFKSLFEKKEGDPIQKFISQNSNNYGMNISIISPNKRKPETKKSLVGKIS